MPRRNDVRLVAVLIALVMAATGGIGSGATAKDIGGSPKRQARAPESQLVLDRAVRLGAADIYRYRQVVDGLEVIDAEAIVRRRGGTRDTAMRDSTQTQIRRPGRATIGRAQAIATATDAVRSKERRGRTTAKLAISRAGGGTLVWLVQIPSLQPLGDFEVLVDARDGDVLSRTNLLRHATGTAKLYDPNPVVENGSLAGLSDNRNRDSVLLTALRRDVVLSNIADGQSCLLGAWAEGRAGRRRKRVCATGLNFESLTRHSKRFEALMAYYHVDRMQTYIQSLDFVDGINERRQVVYASSFRQDNAFYSPFSRKISLGKGGIDDGEDGDVIIHEYGHAIQDDQVRGFGRSYGAAAMGEGFGDYLAAVNTAELSAATPTAEDVACIFDWDALSYKPPCGRRADSTAGYADLPRGCRRSIHCTGQVWSSALLKLRGLLGDNVDGDSIMDVVVLGSHFFLSRSASLSEGAAALIAADDAIYGGAHSAAILAEMQDRDLL